MLVAFVFAQTDTKQSNHIIMTKKEFYQKPEVNVIGICLESSVLSGSYEKGIGSGEDILLEEDEYDPWN